MRFIAHDTICVRRKRQVGIVEENGAPGFFVGDLDNAKRFCESHFKTSHINARNALSQKLAIVFVQEKCATYFVRHACAALHHASVCIVAVEESV